MKAKILILGLMVWLIVGFGVSILYSTELPKVEWDYIKGGIGIGTIKNCSFNKIWEKVQDVLFFQKFKVKGQPFRITHEILSIEKESGVLSVTGFAHNAPGNYINYRLKIIIREKEGHIEIKTQCTSGFKKKVTEKFFQLLKEGLEEEKE